MKDEKDRMLTKAFALAAIRLYSGISQTILARVMGKNHARKKG
jgi:hypothetical protein